jgi:hypothetical protein
MFSLMFGLAAHFASFQLHAPHNNLCETGTR